MHQPKRYLSQHYSARLIAWALTVLGWLVSVLCSDVAPPRRHIRARYRLFSLGMLTRLLVRLAVIRAAEITHIRKRERTVRNTAPAGFRRRMRSASIWRAIIGARLRKALKRGNLAQRIQFLIAAFCDIDAFARRFLVGRAPRRLTKLRPIIMVAPPGVAILRPPAYSPALADSS